jgi:uncharacterized membrane protein YfcA
MNKKLLVGVIVVIVAFVIAAAILGNFVHLYVLAAWLPQVIPLAVWIYLVWVVRKKKTEIFHDQMEPKLAERRLKWLKTLLLVGGISLAVCIGFMLHIVIFRSPDYEGGFFIAFPSFTLFTLSTIGGLVIFLKGRRKQGKETPK